MPTDLTQSGLLPETPDARDLSQEKVFGAATLEELPTGDFFVSEPMAIKDQNHGTTKDFCGGYAGAAVLEDHENEVLDGDFFFMAAKKLICEKTGNPEAWREYGLQIRDIGEAARKIGVISEENFPFIMFPAEDLSREFLSNPANWSEEIFMFAAEHRQNSYFKVDGPHDTFDNFRAALMRGRAKRDSILTGCAFRRSWLSVPKGVIPKEETTEQGFPHAFKIFGQALVPVDGEDGPEELMLVGQLSNGLDVGDKGIFYFPREVVNREFKYGAIQFSDMPKEKARMLQDNGLKVGDNTFYKLIVVLWHAFTAKLGIRT